LPQDDNLALPSAVVDGQQSDGVRALKPLWVRCDYHQVLVRVGTKCSACLAVGPGGLSLRGEHFEIGEIREGWTLQSANAAKSQPTLDLPEERQHKGNT